MSDEDREMKINEAANRICNALVDRADLNRSLIAKAMGGTDIHDIDKECGYPETPSIGDYYYHYKRGGIGTRVVTAEPTACWSAVPRIVEDEDVEGTPFELAWEELADQLNIYHMLRRIDILSGIGRFGILLFGLNDGKELKEPVENVGTGNLEITYLKPFSERALEIVETEADPTNQRYSKPTKYKVTLDAKTLTSVGVGQTGKSPGKTQEKIVHWTRVLHVADNQTESEIYGEPRMENVLNRLIDIRKILSSSGEGFWKGAFRDTFIEADPELIAKGAKVNIESMRDQLEAMYRGVQRFAALQGATANQTSGQPASPKEHLDAQLRAISITKNIPKRILEGTEQAQLAGQQDQEHWGDHIAGRRSGYLSPMLLRPFIDRCVLYGALPEPAQYDVVWPDISEPTEADRAETAGKQTDALRKYVDGGVDVMIPPELYLKHILGLSKEKVEAIMAGSQEYVGAEIEEEEEL